MDYDKVCTQVPGTGVQKFDQPVEAARETANPGNGTGRGYVTQWLIAQSTGKGFWNDRAGVAEAWLTAVRTLARTVDLRAEYLRVAQSRFVPDLATEQALSDAGLKLVIRDSASSARWGFASEPPHDESTKIADTAFSQTSRAFILSIKGGAGGHSLGLYRNTADNVHLFDPNIGEFAASAKNQLRSLLLALGATYKTHGIDLAASYFLWSFSN